MENKDVTKQLCCELKKFTELYESCEMAAQFTGLLENLPIEGRAKKIIFKTWSWPAIKIIGVLM